MDSVTSCPLCGGPHDCGVAAGKSVCWCFSAVVPPEVLGLGAPTDRPNGSDVIIAAAGPGTFTSK